MSTAAEVRDEVYLRHGEREYLARYYRPAGAGPFPAIVAVHGGAWTTNNRLQCASIHEAFAAAGIAVFALDFRMPPDAQYPLPVADINFGIRYFKANAERYATRPELIGALGTSSGGHQLMLNVLRPADERYAALQLPGGEHVDARIAYAMIGWPVVDPVARYRMATTRPFQRLIDAHHAYWPAVPDMEDGSPQHILERGEHVADLPPLLIVQGTNDDNLTPDMADRFAAAYGAHADVRLEKFDDQPHTFVTKSPDIEASQRARTIMIDFVHEQTARLVVR